MPTKAITLADEIREIERELQMRRNVYPTWTSGPKPKLKPDTAQHRIDCLEATLNRLKSLLPPSTEQTSLFPSA